MRDIYYVLFRHKWLIAILAAVGVVGSLATYLLWSAPFVSEAKLYIKYIQETGAPTVMDGNSNVRSPDERGAHILNTELEMLKSLDTAKAAAIRIGAASVLGQPTNAFNDPDAVAGGLILGNLTADVPFKSDVILLQYKARDPFLAQRVLGAVIDAYRNNYVSNHLLMGFGEDELQKQADAAKVHLSETASSLETEKEKVGITSLADTKKEITDMLFQKQSNIYQVEAEMAQNEAAIQYFQSLVPTNKANAAAVSNLTNVAGTVLTQPPPPDIGDKYKFLQAPGPAAATNAGAFTNLSDIASTGAPETPPPDVVDKYRNMTAHLATLRSEEQKWMGELSPNSPRVQNLKKQREAAETEIEKFETDNPGLVAIKSSVTGNGLSSASLDPMAALGAAEFKQRSLAALVERLRAQQAEVVRKAKELDIAEDEITKAETEKDVASAKYKHFLTSQEQARIDAAMGNKVSNIMTVEQPTPGSPDTKKKDKVAASIGGLFLLLAFGLPFFIEMVLDQSFKQPMDVKARIAAPYFITIPLTNGRHKLPALKGAKPVALLSAQGAAASGPTGEEMAVIPSTNGHGTASYERRELRCYFETLRDRLMTYFEMINLTHKPKLVAVTSCGEGAGVTTTATGLASSLSEIGEGNVLLVNMNVRDGKAHHFYKGKLTCGIEDVLGLEKRDQAQVHEHLYVANEMGSGDSLPRVLPKRFSHLVPLMKASDYDYIIFDMPPVSEISITPRLARFMDMVLLVIESGKTSREAGMHAASLLAESKTNVGLVLNKNRSYLPKRLQNT
jgi:Mrp family chromosome partitioning ATPase